MPGFGLQITLLVTLFSVVLAKSLTSSELPNYGGIKTDISGMNPEPYDGSTSGVGSSVFVQDMMVLNTMSEAVNLEAVAAPDSLSGLTVNFYMDAAAPSTYYGVAGPMSASIVKD